MTILQFSEKQYVEVLDEGLTLIGTFKADADIEYTEPTDIRVKICKIGQATNQRLRIYFAGGISDWINVTTINASSRTFLGWVNFHLTFDFALFPGQSYNFQIELENHPDQDNPTIGLVRDFPFQVYDNKDGAYSINSSVNAAQIFGRRSYKIWR